MLVLQEHRSNALMPAPTVLTENLAKGNTLETPPRITHRGDLGSVPGIHDANGVVGFWKSKIRRIAAQQRITRLLHIENNDSVLLQAGGPSEKLLAILDGLAHGLVGLRH